MPDLSTVASAAQVIIDRGGRFLLNRAKTPSALTANARVSWSRPAGKPDGTDRDRVIEERERVRGDGRGKGRTPDQGGAVDLGGGVSGEKLMGAVSVGSPRAPRPPKATGKVLRTGDYTADEVAGWLARGLPYQVGLLVSTIDDGLCVVDYDEGVGSAEAWSDLMGRPIVMLPSSGGKGKHAWYRWPESGRGALPSLVRSRLPGLTGACEDVVADLIFHSRQVVLRDADSVVRLASALSETGSGACRLPPDVRGVFQACVVAQEDSPLRTELAGLVATGEGGRHNAVMSGMGKAWQGDLRRAGPDGFLARAYVECTLVGTADDGARATVGAAVSRIGLARRAEWEAEYPFGNSEESSSRVSRRVLRPVIPCDAAGLSHILGEMGVQLGRDRLGRRQFKVDLGDGDGWQPLGNTALSVLCGRIGERYAKGKGKDSTADWWMEQAAVTGLCRSWAGARRIDVFGDYLASLPVVRYDDSAASRLLAIPHDLWRFDNSDETVGFAFRSLMCAAVSRNMHPGAKYDLVLVLRGEQGIGKSSFVRALLPGGERFRPLFGKCNLRLLGESGGEKRLVENTMGKTICEIPEMKGVRDIEAVKDFITREEDEMRMAYDSDTMRVPRTTVLVATTNRDEPVQFDPSGNRRFVGLSLAGLNPALTEDGARPYRALWRALDNGLRDEWWTLAKAAVAHVNSESAGEVWGDGVGNPLLTPDQGVERLLQEEGKGFMRTNAVLDDLTTLMEGLRLDPGETDGEVRYALPLIPANLLLDALYDGQHTEKTRDLGMAKNGMSACGWVYDRLRYESVDGDDERTVQRYVFYPKSAPPVPYGQRARVDMEYVRVCLDMARDGVPFTSGRLEEAESRVGNGGGSSDRGVRHFSGRGKGGGVLTAYDGGRES